ncbi:DNA-binding transcriptional regulator, MurR/RpiR family, contains HTH and SIS domains [Halobacillus karajensis]|uniref:HTH-type transcriptional regulator YbbH n=1 Tax=Halobacillus karajensis TaxID=195088 RepID=A0A024PBK0_9BACI|nr:MurR/RpiR family transcriptional regulator [Halobacillus karajensis]CDQ21791.1 putative HTH-type transcriptional regulator YbbH [Halobacillus karajensis]CDQ25787.1 putative HTH-type transcriptional regulator YbbH [Halobacillus karajensis]CDQ29788.1 putative HTH-type transcriptional regulator YbbH [Halobacillus karajensis]SEI12367.1 DNA-binding transcriptional regulator, MurR/RpiR family, contains HTH and SIS domains [Halobacillus karajensis]
MENNVYKKINEKIPKMSKSQRKIAQYILENPNEVPFLNVGKLAKCVGVSDATIVRFAIYLGFSGYPEFQEHIQSSVQQQLTAKERLQMSEEVYGNDDQGIIQVLSGDIKNIQTTMDHLNVKDFRKSIDHLLKARKVYIVANRSAASLGIFLHYYLDFILDHVDMLHSIEKDADLLHDLQEGDLVIGISYSRYTRSTVDVFAYAKEKGASTVALTDDLLSPLHQHTDVSLMASSQMPAFIDSFVAPLSVINALIIHTAKEKRDGFDEKLDTLEDVWNRFNIFY